MDTNDPSIVIFLPRPPCQGPRPLEGWGAEQAIVPIA